MTEHFPACLSSISSPITTSGSGHKWNGPDDIFILSLQLAIEQLNNLTSLTKSLISNSRSDDSKADLKQCEIQIDDSLDRLNRSLTASATVLIFSGRPEDGDNPEIQLQKENLAGEKIDYMMPRVNDSVSDLRNCFQLLVKVDETVGNVDELRGRVHNAMVDAGIAFDFLQNRDEINYRLQYVNMSSGYDRNFWDFTTLLMSFPQYLFLVVLFWLIYRMY
ncbi:hypothetical protein M9H77_04895 [Catharanthus roseus]|uniref:Uncharacterized protein n=1 Tax=Catharanthus roseus TaxID=4058 RepID=A0ACC0CFR0_CATRO|nr:hypothetical protein M9H77_04895 [Catharanthus roseus]